MRPEKSKLLKISLCVLSCVFFGCGKPQSNGTGTVLTSDTIKKQLAQPGTNIQQDNSPFMKLLSNAMTNVLSKKGNKAVQELGKYIDENGNIKAEMTAKLGDPESEDCKKFIEALEDVIAAINTEVEVSLGKYDLTDSFGVTDQAIKEWTEKGVKDREVAKVISAWQVIYSDYSKFIENPLQFLIKSGKGWMHRSTVKAIDLAWRNFVGFLQKGCEKCESSLKAFINKNSSSDKDKEVAKEAENVMKAISADLSKIKEFVDDHNSIRVSTLNKVYSLIGNQFLPNYGDAFFDLINCKDSSSEDAGFKVTSAWGNAVFSHLYLGVKSDRGSFSNPASAFSGKTMSDLKEKGYKDGFGKYSEKYEALFKDFVKFAIETKIISAEFFQQGAIDDICKYLEYHSASKSDKSSKLNDGREKISLSPWLMRCAKKNWEKISTIVKFEKDDNVWTVKFVGDQIKNIDDLVNLVKVDKNYENLEVYAGIFACFNLIYGLRHYKEGKSVGKNGDGFNLSQDLKEFAQNTDLKKYALKGRLKQWDDFKTAAENGTLKEEE